MFIVVGGGMGVLVGESSLRKAEFEQPGVVAAFIVLGSPLPVQDPSWHRINR